MSDPLANTLHDDAPLSAAHHPDARAAGLAAMEDDELSGRTVTINLPLAEVRGLSLEAALLRSLLDPDFGTDADSIVVERDAAANALEWRTAPGSEKRTAGRMEFRPAPAGRGTEVTVTLVNEARGAIRKALDRVTRKDPRIQTRRVLRRFKQLLETGEIATASSPRAD